MRKASCGELGLGMMEDSPNDCGDGSRAVRGANRLRRLRDYLISSDGRARLLLLFTSLVAFPELLTFSRVLVADDGGTSDAFNGELAGRVLLGRMLASGDCPHWTSTLGAGYPIGAGLLGDPFGVLYFSLFSPAVALSAFLLTVIWIAAQGTYGFSRHLGASRWGAVFAGTAFASGGYFVSQLRHLSVLATVAWLPLVLLLLDQALAGRSRGIGEQDKSLRYRLGRLLLLGFVVAIQANAGFPQSTYICLLAAVIYAVPLWFWRTWKRRRWPEALTLGGSAVWVVSLGILSAGLTLLSLAELAAQSGRDASFASSWVHAYDFQFKYLLNFFSPDLYGNAAVGTYQGTIPYWEAYAYSGLLTAVLGVSFAFTGFRHPRHLPLILVGAFGLVCVLGFKTPLFGVLWDTLPGFNRFRFPTRFLVVVVLALCVFAGLQLSTLEAWLSRRAHGRHRFWGKLPPGWVSSYAFTVALLVDLGLHQPMQNPLEPASEWLSPPSSVRYLKTQGKVRIHSMAYGAYHFMAYNRAQGWKYPSVLRRLLPALAPNLPAFFDIQSIDVYSGAAPAGWAEMWSIHANPSPFPLLSDVSEVGAVLDARYFKVMRIFGVTHLLSPVPLRGVPSGTLVHSRDHIYVYAVDGHRARCVRRAQSVANTQEAFRRLFGASFDPDDVVLLHPDPDAEFSMERGSERSTSPVYLEVEDIDSNRISLDVSTCQGRYVFVADTWFPGWSALVDGQPERIFRANIAGRAVAVPPGAKRLTMAFEPPSWKPGLWLSLTGLLLLALTAFVVLRFVR
ncbi:MAG: hypothetical protein JXR76_29230 [Deltaproteobacteria bacterium]|nr:hypothetical protein [Deltaproteobacteria bacterium]